LSADLRIAAPPEPVPYRERVPDLQQILERQGSLGLLLVDISELTPVEHHYGSGAFTNVRGVARDLLLEMGGAGVRTSDILAVDDKGGDAFLVFLSPKRHEGPLKVSDIRRAAERVEDHLNHKLSRLASPYLTGPRQVVVGFSLVFENPLVMPERLVSRLVDEAWECVRVQRRQRDLLQRCSLQEVLLEDKLATLFQPVFELSRRTVLGFEALSRGPSGTPYHMPLRLFEMASQSDLVFELDRKCRRRALEASRQLPRDALLFVNVFPSAMYDPEFQGAPLLRLLRELDLRPDRVVLEITEKYAIENYGLFAEALEEFTKLGFQIAVDDVGAGYSGLEKIAHLNPRYLKLDRELIKDIDSSYIRREMARALKAFADKIGSTIIAEGIEREGELRTLIELGIDYGQGFLLGRPMAGVTIPPPNAPRRAPLPAGS
jgi:EAL domain-containing protein (putative c-di-GMP-specific phosphodiesterase class I)